MKGERRHELQHNDLLIWINRLIERVKPYSTLAVLLAILVLVSILGWRWWNHQSSTEAAQAWDDLFGAMDSGNPSLVSQVAESRPDSRVGQWSAVVAAEMYLNKGCQELFRDKLNAGQDLRKAVTEFSAVLSTSRTPAIRQRATFGLAKACEALTGTPQSQGDLEKAIENYQLVASTWPDGPYAKEAALRAEDLQRHDMREFYDKFAKYEPKPTFSEKSAAGNKEGPPALDLKSLDEMSAPNLSKGTGSTENAKQQTAPKEEAADKATPAAGASKQTAPGQADTASQKSNGADAPATSPPAPAEQPANK